MKIRGFVNRHIIARKWLVILFVIAFLVFFGRIVNNLSLSQSGIVVGLAIDYKENLFVVSAQIVSVNGTATQGASQSSYVTVTEKDSSVAGAFDKINRKTGLITSLSHCNILIMSKEAFSVDHYHLLSSLTVALSMPEQAVILATEEEPEKVLTSKISTAGTFSFFAQMTLVQNLGTDGMSRVSIKDFLASSMSRSATIMLPLVETYPDPQSPISSSVAENEGGSSESNSSGGSEYVKVSMDKGLAIKKNRSVVVDAEIARSVTMFLFDDLENKLDVTLPNGGNIVFRILKKRENKKAEGTSVSSKIKLNVSFIESQNLPAGDRINSSSPEVQEAAKLLEENLTKRLNDAFEFSLSCGFDLLQLENTVYQKVGRTLPKDCLSDISFSPSYEVVVNEQG